MCPQTTTKQMIRGHSMFFFYLQRELEMRKKHPPKRTLAGELLFNEPISLRIGSDVVRGSREVVEGALR